MNANTFSKQLMPLMFFTVATFVLFLISACSEDLPNLVETPARSNHGDTAESVEVTNMPAIEISDTPIIDVSHTPQMTPSKMPIRTVQIEQTPTILKPAFDSTEVSEQEVITSTGKVVFRSRRTDTNEDGIVDIGDGTHIYLLDTETGNINQITSGQHQDRSPSLNPDGTKIAFISNRGGNLAQLYTTDIDGSNIVQITDSPSEKRCPDWSPDGSQIAYVATENLGNENTISSVEVFDFQAGRLNFELQARRREGVLIKTLMKDYGLSKTSVYRYLKIESVGQLTSTSN